MQDEAGFARLRKRLTDVLLLILQIVKIVKILLGMKKVSFAVNVLFIVNIVNIGAGFAR